MGSTTSVASTVYNLAGDPDLLPQVLRAVVVSHALNGNRKKQSLGEALTQALLSGQSMKQRQFFRWAKTNYGYGMPTATVGGSTTIDTSAILADLRAQIGVAASSALNVIEAYVDFGTADHFAEFWVQKNYPSASSSQWSALWVPPSTIRVDTSVINPGSTTYDLAASSDLIWAQGDVANRRLLYTIYTVTPSGGSAGPLSIFTYRMGSGIASFDALSLSGSSLAEFYPAIPLRLDNSSIRGPGLEAVYAKVEPAYKKLTGFAVDDLLDQIEDHENIGDIDFCFLVQGVALSTRDDVALQYLYEFFDILRQRQGSAGSTNQFQIQSATLPSFNVVISWSSIEEIHSSGVAMDSSGSALSPGQFCFIADPDGSVKLYRQITASSHSRMVLRGMEHRNYVYGGIPVVTSAWDAVQVTGDTSAFLVPLHDPTMRKLGLAKSTQLALSNTHLVFNCYVVVKRKWWQTGFFRILLVVGMAILSVVLPPAGAGLTATGVLGSNLAVGAALGLTTPMAAAIAGAIANAMAAAVITTLVSDAAIALFGDKLGAIIGAIASIVALGYTKAFMNTGSFNVDWGAAIRADKIGMLVNPTVSASKAWAMASIADTYEDLALLQESYEDQLQAIQDKSEDILGMTSGEIDPMMLLDSLEEDYSETPEQFLARTTMTGDDIVALSQSMIDDFTEVSLQLPDLDMS